jgi:hypothetical protein
MERRYQACYPGTQAPAPNDPCGDDRGIADEMIARRREQRTLDSVADLVQVLGAAREERKAVLLLSEGWPLYRPSRTLTRPTPLGCRLQQPSAIGRAPSIAGLRSTAGDPARPDERACEADLAYHSTGNLDGTFHRITVRVTRPGVQVRARPGFLATPPPVTQTAASVRNTAGTHDGQPVHANDGSPISAHRTGRHRHSWPSRDRHGATPRSSRWSPLGPGHHHRPHGRCRRGMDQCTSGARSVGSG